MRALATKYQERQYRSLLEAKWAAFFRNIGWRVEYEPFEFYGWIPGFVTISKPPVLIEVKPVTDFVSVQKVRDALCEAAKDEQGYEALLVGVAPFALDAYEGDHAYSG